jgi:hypothetical protein
MTPDLRAFALAFGQPETPAPELSPNGYPQVLVNMEKLIAAIREAERAAYERAAEVCNGENAAWREMWDGQPIYYACRRFHSRPHRQGDDMTRTEKAGLYVGTFIMGIAVFKIFPGDDVIRFATGVGMAAFPLLKLSISFTGKP